MKLLPCALSTLVRHNFLHHTLTTDEARRRAIASCPCPKHASKRKKGRR